MPSLATSHISLYSEYLFVLLSSLSFYYVLRGRKSCFVYAGLLTGLAIWVRPLAYAWFVVAIYLGIIHHKKPIYIVNYLVSLFIICFTISLATHLNFPDYLYSAKTGGVNMIMGADDSADGSYNLIPRITGGNADVASIMNDKVYQTCGGKGVRSFEHTTYAQVDSVYMAKSIEWVKANPGKWLGMIPRKLYLLFGENSLVVYPKKADNKVVVFGLSKLFSIQRLIIIFFFLISFCGLFSIRMKNHYDIAVIIPIVISTVMTIVCVSSPRYNFVFLHLLILFSLLTIQKIAHNHWMTK